MSEETGATIKPSKIAITKMLAEIESTRKHATKYWLLALLLPLLLGAGLLAYTSRKIYVSLERLKELNNEIVEAERRRDELIADNERLSKKLETVLDVASHYPEAQQAIIDATSPKQNVPATPRVFIYMDAEQQSGKVREVAQELRGSGYIVQSIKPRPENVDGNQVKFFRQEDREAAEKVAAILAGHGVKDAKLVLLRRPRAQPGQIEIWFGSAPAVQPPDGGKLTHTKVPAAGDVTILRLHGQVTGDGVNELRSTLAPLRQRKVLLDLGDISRIDDQGMQAIVSEYTAFNRAGGRLKLFNVAGKITDLLTITKLLTIFDNYESEAEAVKSFGP